MKPQPRLQDMPDLVKQQIADNLDFYVDKMSLRGACPNFRPIIGNPKFECEWLDFQFFGMGRIELNFQHSLENYRRQFLHKENGCQVTIKEDSGYFYGFTKRRKIEDKDMFVEGGSFIDLAISDFEMLFDNPNITMKSFRLNVENSAYNRNQIGFGISMFLDKLQPVLMKAKLKVEGFQMAYERDQNAVLQVLPHLDSDALKSLNLTAKRNWGIKHEQETRLDEIVKLEQWKRVESLSLRDFDVPVELWWNFPKTHIQPRNDDIEDLKRILKHFRKSPSLQYSNVKTGFKDIDIARAFGGDKAGFDRVDDYQYTYLYKTKTKLGLHVYIRDGYVEFTRRPHGWREGQEDYYERIYASDDDDEEEEEEEDRHLESQKILETLKNKFCKALEMPVMVGMVDGVVKHFEWDNEKKTWKKVDCEKCKQEEQDFGRYGIFEDDAY